MSKHAFASLLLATASLGVWAQDIPQGAFDYAKDKIWEYELRWQQQSPVKPHAWVNGNLLLRDAHYRYEEKIVPEGDEIIFLAVECDIYQIVLTVLDGSVSLVTIEATGTSEYELSQGIRLYPDKLGIGAGMFAYTLYSNNPLKGFMLKNGDYQGDDRSAEVTAFGYCFSTWSDADSAFMNTYGEIFD